MPFINGQLESQPPDSDGGTEQGNSRWPGQREMFRGELTRRELTRRELLRSIGCVGCFGLLAVASGCQTVSSNSSLPAGQRVVRDQLIVHSDFHLPKRHRLLDELVARRTDVTDLLNLPTSDEPINVYLFKDADEFRRFMQRRFPNFPNRRAFFVLSLIHI